MSAEPSEASSAAAEPRDIDRRRLPGRQHRRLVAFGPAAVRQEGAHGLSRPAEHGASLPSSPDPRRQERLQRDRGRLERDTDGGRVERRGDRAADALARERLLLGLKGQISDAEPRDGQRAGHPARRRRRKPDVERPRIELRLGVLVGGHLQEDDALRPGRSIPSAPRPPRAPSDRGPNRPTRYGPLPTKRIVPSVPVTVFEMPSPGWARTVSSGAYGWTNSELHGMRIGSTHFLDDARAGRAARSARRRPRAARIRWKLAATSDVVTALPSWNRTPSRTVNVQVRPSRDTAQRVARAGSTSVEPSR